jgi:hypothetical protein
VDGVESNSNCTAVSTVSDLFLRNTFTCCSTAPVLSFSSTYLLLAHLFSLFLMVVPLLLPTFHLLVHRWPRRLNKSTCNSSLELGGLNQGEWLGHRGGVMDEDEALLGRMPSGSNRIVAGEDDIGDRWKERQSKI